MDADIQINGEGCEEAWKSALVLNHFKPYWNPQDPQKTELRLFSNGKALCFLYTVEDSEVVRRSVINEEMDIADEDRVVFGFSPEDHLAPYYFFEIDSKGRVLDYEAKYYRHFDESWDCDGLEVFAKDTDHGYTVEGKFPLDSLRTMNVLRPDGTLLAGFFRGDYVKDGDDDSNHVWISWIYPQTKDPDLHIRSAFGTLRIEDK